MTEISFFSAIFKYSPLGFVITDDSMRLVEVNKKMFSYFSLEPCNYRGMRFGNVFKCSVVSDSNKICGTLDECKLCDLNKGITAVINEAKTISNVEICRTFDVGGTNNIKWFNVSASNVELGKKKYIVISFLDITDSKKLQINLEKNEEKYRLLFENISQGFALHNIIINDEGQPVDYRFISINKAFENLTGLKADDIVGKTVLEVLPKTEKYWIETYGKVALTGDIHYFENYSAELDKYYDGIAYSPQKGRFAVIFSDVTKHKELERELRESEHKFKSYIDFAPDAVFVSDENGFFKDVNKAAIAMMGYSIDELLKMNAIDIIPDEYKDHVIFEYNKLVQEGKTSIETPYITRNGQRRILRLNAVKISNSTFIGFCTDITQENKTKD